MIKCLPKIFKIAKRDENTTFVLEKKDFDSLFFVVVMYCYTFSIPQILVK